MFEEHEQGHRQATADATNYGNTESSPSSTSSSSPSHSSKSWIRGVNIGGWLLMERFITPYMFALNSCQLNGEFCFYPGQISAPPTTSPHHKYCDLYQCTPHMIDNAQTGQKDYPTDEYTLANSFESKATLKEYLNFHYENFISKEDVVALKEAGVTHVRVPLPHWIMGDIDEENEPYVDGQWLYFVRFVNWCREMNIEVWPDIHTAPGSQNGFDNSGHLLKDPTCKHWSDSEDNIKRSLKAVDDISKAVVRDSMKDVVTGFGILNEPWFDCDEQVVRTFYNNALKLVRKNMGDSTYVFVGDIFKASNFNNGFWIDSEEYSNTLLDSHYYHVFAERPRSLSPKQHIAYVCQKNGRDTEACCYSDHSTSNSLPSKGIARLIGEWSASYDTLVVAKLAEVMAGIEKNGVATEFNRTISDDRKTFLKDFVKAQMVTYEVAHNPGVSKGWFYWTLKTEGGAFAEWNFLRGIKEKWIPTLPKPSETSVSNYGTCHEIAERTIDDKSIVDEFPNPDKVDKGSLWLGDVIDDDYVVSHADSMTLSHKKGTNEKATSSSSDTSVGTKPETAGDDDEVETTSASASHNTVDSQISEDDQHSGGVAWFPLFVIGFFVYAIWRVFFRKDQLRGFVGGRGQYSTIGGSYTDTPTQLNV